MYIELDDLIRQVLCVDIDITRDGRVLCTRPVAFDLMLVFQPDKTSPANVPHLIKYDYNFTYDKTSVLT